MAVKSIRPELESRLREVGEERQRLQNRLAQLQEVEAALNIVLKEESIHFHAQQLALLPVKTVNGRKVIGQSPISRFLVKILGDGKSLPLQELAELAKAENIDFQGKNPKGKNPKRVLHFALIGLQRNGYAEMTDKSVWRLTSKALSAQSNIDIKGQAAAVAGR